MFVVLAFSPVAKAQFVPWGDTNTSRGAELEGLGDALHGQADHVRALGEYQNSQQDALSKELTNKKNRIVTRWAIQDLYHKRLSNRPSYLDRKERHLEVVKRSAELKKVEDELVKQGVLKRLPTQMTYNGNVYNSYADFKRSIDFEELQTNTKYFWVVEEMKDRLQESREQEAVIFSVMWNKMDRWQKDRFNRMTKGEQNRYVNEWFNPDLKWNRLERENQRKDEVLPPDFRHRHEMKTIKKKMDQTLKNLEKDTQRLEQHLRSQR